MPVTLDIDPSKFSESNQPRAASIFEHLAPDLKKNGGLLLKSSNSKEHYIKSRFSNGFVGACIYAYNLHYHLVLGPDEVWIAIVAAFSRYVNAHSERLRDQFVDHQGQLTIRVEDFGTLETADYGPIISKISDQIDETSKGEVRSWVECDFSTSTPHTKTVSKLMLMSAMKEYYKYEVALLCGLPKVTLNGTEDDWKSIQARVRKLKEFEDETLSEWAGVLDLVLEEFVSAFSSKKPDKDFWNRVAHYTGGGSGPRYLEGWVLAFVAFDEEGGYFLNSLAEIKATNKFGTRDTSSVPSATVQVPIKITNPDGVEYNTLFYAGAMLPAALNDETVTPAVDWAIAIISAKNGSKDLPLPKTPFSGASVWFPEFEDPAELDSHGEPHFSRTRASSVKQQKQKLKQKKKEKQKEKQKSKQKKCIIS